MLLLVPPLKTHRGAGAVVLFVQMGRPVCAILSPETDCTWLDPWPGVGFYGVSAPPAVPVIDAESFNAPVEEAASTIDASAATSAVDAAIWVEHDGLGCGIEEFRRRSPIRHILSLDWRGVSDKDLAVRRASWDVIAKLQSVPWEWVMACELSLAGLLAPTARLHP